MSPDAIPAMTRPARKAFVKRTPLVRMTPDAAARQGRVTKVAWDTWGDRDAVLAFLNTHDEALGGRPLDLAIADDSGLTLVEAAIADRSLR